MLPKKTLLTVTFFNKQSSGTIEVDCLWDDTTISSIIQCTINPYSYQNLKERDRETKEEREETLRKTRSPLKGSRMAIM